MKPLKQLRSSKLMLYKNECHMMLKYAAKNKNIDFDVFLPTKGISLQRGFVWELWQKRELIMSILMRRFIPHLSMCVVIGDNENDVLQIIDGKQRLSSMIGFVNNAFTLEFDGVEYYFKDLPNEYKVVIEGYMIPCFRIYDTYIEITDNDKIEWFKMINFNQTPQDLEHLRILNEL